MAPFHSAPKRWLPRQFDRFDVARWWLDHAASIRARPGNCVRGLIIRGWRRTILRWRPVAGGGAIAGWRLKSVRWRLARAWRWTVARRRAIARRRPVAGCRPV